jgi:hypothetical protein
VKDVRAKTADVEQITGTNETLVRQDRGSDTSSVSAGTFVNIVDTTEKDNRGSESVSGPSFQPDRTGEYEFQGFVRFKNITGGTIVIKLQDVSNSTTQIVLADRGATEDFETYPFSATFELTAGVDYQIQATNEDQSFTLEGTGGFNCQVTWTRTLGQS